MLQLTNKYALVEYQKATLEHYNPSIVFESDDIEFLESIDSTDYVNEGPTCGCTIVEKTNEGIIDYYTGEEFSLNTYN